MLRLSLAALLALSLAACGDEPVDPAQTERVPEADVARFQAEVFQETIPLDADLAQLEAEVAQTDSLTRVAFTPVLNRLREDRRRLQVRLDGLRPTPRAQFDSTRQVLQAQTEQLRSAIRRAPFEAAPTYAALQANAGRALARLDAQLAALGPAATADTTGALRTAIDSIGADRARLAARIGAYPDTSATQFAPFRQSVTDGLVQLEARAREIAPDSTRTTAPDA